MSTAAEQVEVKERREAMDEWWRNDAKEIYRGDSDGQQFTCVFMRKVASQTEYAIVQCSDGDYLDHVFGGVVICNGGVTPIEPD